MFTLKPLSKTAIPHALEKAERYRLLNEPAEAESICLDALKADPENQHALVTLLLALTDQFRTGIVVSNTQIQEILPRLSSEYERYYYAGIIAERKGSAVLEQSALGSKFMAYDLLCEAMKSYEKAESLRPAGNDDAILRWNTCARIIMRNNLVAQPPENYEPSFE